MNINPDTLKAAGYREFPHHMGEGCTHGFQRTIYDDDRNKLYFITVYLWDFSTIYRMPRPSSVEVDIGFFQKGTISDPEYTNIRTKIPVWNPKTEISQIEILAEDIYVKLGCIPDYHNN